MRASLAKGNVKAGQGAEPGHTEIVDDSLEAVALANTTLGSL